MSIRFSTQRAIITPRASADESTFLLPHHRPLPEEDEESSSQRRPFWTRLLVLTALVVLTAAVVTVQKLHSSTSASLLTDWRDEAGEWGHEASEWTQDKAARTERLRNRTKEFKDDADKAWHQVEEGSEHAWHKTKHGAKHAWNATEHGAKQAWNATVQTAEEGWDEASTEWWPNAQDWFHRTWKATGKQLRHVWKRMRQAEEGAAESSREWWNETSQKEHSWYNHTIHNLHQFGGTVKGFWNDTTHGMADKEQTVQHNFQQWWKNANEKERAWWNDTVHAFGRFSHYSADKGKLFWNVTKHTVSDDWNATVTKEREWWNATSFWFATHLAGAVDVDEELNRPLLYLNQSSAYSLLTNGYGWYDYSYDFFALQRGWDAQINQAYCGVAASAALLNSLGGSMIELPVDPLYTPYHYATQLSLVSTSCVRKRVVLHNETFDGVSHMGLSLSQVRALLQCHLPSSTQVTAYPVDPSKLTHDQVRQDLSRALKDHNSRVLINYDRAVLGQHGSGHFSPLGSYSKTDDSFLIMDVAKYKYPPVWVPSARLYAAMSSVDSCGSWDFPTGVDRLPQYFGPNATVEDTMAHWSKIQKKLDCRADYRGYIIVTVTDDEGSA